MNDSIVEWNKTCSVCNSRFVDRISKPFPVRVSDFKVSHGTCKECRDTERLEYSKHHEAACLYSSFESVKEHFENNPPIEGQELLVHDTSWNTNTYALVTVKVAASGRQKRIIIESYSNGYSGQAFYRSGKNCWSPKGQVKLLPYNTIIGNLIKKNSNQEIRLSSKEVYLLGEDHL